MEGENWMENRSDYQKGLSYTEIGKKIQYGLADSEKIRRKRKETGV